MMRRGGWHMLRAGAGDVTLTRRVPVRFDLAAETRFPPLRAPVLAHEIRKDLWRSLRGLRGFSPAVEVRTEPGGLRVRAGGRVTGQVPPGTSARIGALLEDTGLRARWIAHARCAK